MNLEKRIDYGEWHAIENGDTLKLSFNYTGASKNKLDGIYGYKNSINLNIDLDKIGTIKMNEYDILFAYPLSLTAPQNIVNLPIRVYENETLLVIRNTLNTSITEVKYKKVAFK